MNQTPPNKAGHAAREHARLGASDSKRWILCPGCIAFQEKYYADHPQAIPPRDNSAANEGEFAHELAEWCYHTKNPAISAAAKRHFRNTQYDLDTICQQVHKYYGYIKSQATAGAERQIFCELRVDYSNWVADGFGTIDLAIFDGDCCQIFDLKYGRIPVRARESSNPENINSQLGLYALGLLQHLRGQGQEPAAFELHIVQPRIGNYDKLAVSSATLLSFGDYVSGRAQLALGSNPPLIPGREQCQWCDVKDVCPARRANSSISSPVYTPIGN